MGKIKIENIVASATLNKEIDLRKVAMHIDAAEYNPSDFPGLIYKLKEPKTAALIFRSGKIVCTGAKTMDDIKTLLSSIVKSFNEAGIKINKVPKPNIENIVASASIGAEVNLNDVVISLGLDRVEYEPEQFPGLVYRIEDPKVVLLLFGTGKMVCTGAKTPEDAEKAVEILIDELKSLGLLH